MAIKRCQIDIADQDFRTAVLRELRIMASGHENIIRLGELTLWRSELWIGMDLMRCSVFSVLCQRGIPEEFTVYIAREVEENMLWHLIASLTFRIVFLILSILLSTFVRFFKVSCFCILTGTFIEMSSAKIYYWAKMVKSNSVIVSRFALYLSVDKIHMTNVTRFP